MSRQPNLFQAAAIVAALQEITQTKEIDHERLSHALDLMVSGNAYYSHQTNSWMCQSKTHANRVYAVDLHNELCTCPDRTHRGTYCKHLIACWLAWRVGEIYAKAHAYCAAPESLIWLERLQA